MSVLAERCERLRSLHVAGSPLLLPNAWDAASARVVEAAGFPVVATTSGGVAHCLGYGDHQAAPRQEMLAAAARIGRAVAVPVTVDAEAGYGLSASELVESLIEAGAAGCNLEDTVHETESLRDPQEQASWLAEVRAAAAGRDYPLVINARVDVFLHDSGAALEAGVERARAYLAAGADCVYPITLADHDLIGRFVTATQGPVNILSMPGAPSVAELTALGVARVSLGGGLHRWTMEQPAHHLGAVFSGDR